MSDLTTSEMDDRSDLVPTSFSVGGEWDVFNLKTGGKGCGGLLAFNGGGGGGYDDNAFAGGGSVSSRSGEIIWLRNYIF
jgi:hypothetical protein